MTPIKQRGSQHPRSAGIWAVAQHICLLLLPKPGSRKDPDIQLWSPSRAGGVHPSVPSGYHGEQREERLIVVAEGLRAERGAGGAGLKCLCFSVWGRTSQGCDALNILLHCNSPQGVGDLLEVLKALRDGRKTPQLLSAGFLPITSFSSSSFFICVYLLCELPPSSN